MPLSAQTTGQNLDSLPNYFSERVGNAKNVLIIKADGNFASNFIDKDLITNNFWDKEIVLNQVNRLRKTNIGGLDAEVSLEVHLFDKRMFKSESMSPWFGAKHQQISGISLNKDIVKVILQGNSENRSVSFDQGNNALQYIASSQLYAGFTKTQSSSSFKMALGLVFGHNLSSHKLISGTLETDQNGDYIDARFVDFSIETAQSSMLTGIGGVAHLTYLNEVEPGTTISLSLADFGFLNWRNVETIRPVNNSFTYEGFDLSGFWQADYSASLEDSLEGNYIKTDNFVKAKLLPFKVSAELLYPLGTDNFMYTHLRYRYISGYIPMVSIGYGQYYKNGKGRWSIGTDIGGFGLAALNFRTDVKLSQSSGFRLNLSGIESLASPNLSIYWVMGTGLYFNF